MEGILKTVEPIVNNLSKDFENCTPVVFLAQKTGLKPGHIVGAGFILGIFLVITGIASDLITALMGFLYPAYMSFKALETADEGDDVQWLTYWVVFVLITFLDSVFGTFLSIIPLYHVIKLVFFIYLFYPKSKGATVIYQNFLKPLLQKYESKIDSTLDKADQLRKNVESRIHQD